MPNSPGGKSKSTGLLSRLPEFLRVRNSRPIYWTIVIALGAVQALAHRFQVDHDGVNYLDIADNYAHGAWRAAINAYWSPFYSWLLALGVHFVQFPRAWESTFLHLVNFAAYLCAYRCFEFLLEELVSASYVKGTPTSFSAGSWRLLGLGLFLYSSLYMANHAGSTPDIILTVFAYLAMGLLLRICSGHAEWRTFACFGVALSFGYFAKTAMFLLAFVFLAVAVAVVVHQRERRVAFLCAPVCFLLIAGTWVGVLSWAKGRLSYGDSGRLAYTYLVQPKTEPFAWSGATDPAQHLMHPPRRIGEEPPVIEFATPVPGTFPLWYDSPYWLAGSKTHFSLQGQLRVLRLSSASYFAILNNQREDLVLIVALFLLQDSGRAYFRRLRSLWPVLIPPLAAMGLYSLVLVEPRYVSPFTVIFWLGLFAAIRLPVADAAKFQRFADCAILATVLVTGIVLFRGALSDTHSMLAPKASEQAEVANGLQKLGLAEGSTVSLIGTSRESFEWARLAGLRIVSIVPNENVNEYWFGTAGTQERVSGLFATTSAIAIITDFIPTGASAQGWKRIGQTSYSIKSISGRSF